MRGWGFGVINNLSILLDMGLMIYNYIIVIM